MNPSVTPLRYPGGKSTLINYVENFLIANNINSDISMVEPFAGSASVTVGLLRDKKIYNAYINDSDPLIYSFWKTILNYNDEFVEMINSIDISLDEWLEYQKYLIADPLSKFNQKELALAFFFLNRTSYSGIIKAGPLGGKKQLSKYNISCRFNKKMIIKKIQFLEQFNDKIEVYNRDGIDFMNNILNDNKDIFFYVDPPYYDVGRVLYREYFNDQKHIELSNYLKFIQEQPWLLSYNNHEFILKLYQNTKTQTVFLDYHSGNYHKNVKEYVFSNRFLPSYEINIGGNNRIYEGPQKQKKLLV